MKYLVWPLAIVITAAILIVVAVVFPTLEGEIE